MLLSCKQVHTIPAAADIYCNTNIIKYLKDNFRIKIDTSQINPYYKDELRKKIKTLEIDSLINNRILTEEYKPLTLRFIKYDNDFGIQDSSRKNHFSVNIIEDGNSGTYYIDYIDPMAGMISEDFCMWTSRDDKISENEMRIKISKEDISAYNSINSDRTYGENETRIKNKKMGIQTYLNTAFKFSRPGKAQLDSLFYSYDKYFYHRWDTLLKSPDDLYGYLRSRANVLRSKPQYGSLNERLGFLKEQINLLLIMTQQPLSENLIFWIYKNGSRLRVRNLLISGNDISTYSYNVTENEMCF